MNSSRSGMSCTSIRPRHRDDLCRNGAKACAELFPDALWIAYVDPGYTLSRKVADEMAAYKKARGTDPKVIFLQNHGVFAGADTDTEINAIYDNIMSTLKAAYAKAGIAVELKRSEPDFEASKLIAPKLRTILGVGEGEAVRRKFITWAGNSKSRADRSPPITLCMQNPSRWCPTTRKRKMSMRM
ncbi:MAG: hypothetical protein V8T87_17295 [Victivallales bacterium]